MASQTAGIRRLDGASWTAIASPGSGAHALEILPDGTLWASWADPATGIGTVGRLKDGSWTSLPSATELVRDSAWSSPWPPQNLVVSPANEVWSATTGGPLLHYDGQAWGVVDRLGSAEFGRVFLIAGDGKGGLWATGTAGPDMTAPTVVGHFDGAAWVVYGRDGVPQWKDVYQGWPGSMAVAPDGTLWLTRALSGDCYALDAFDATTWTSYLGFGSCVYALDIAPDGTVWTMTSGGLYRIRR